MIRLSLAIALAFAGCKSETARRAGIAADEVVLQRQEVVKTAVAKPDQIVVETEQLSEAEREFADRKRIRIAALRGEHSVIGSQVNLIATMAEYFPLTDAGRADVNEKLSAFQQRLGEAKDHIDGLAGVDATTWKQRDDKVREVMESLDKARAAAWEALQDAPRTDPNAS